MSMNDIGTVNDKTDAAAGLIYDYEKARAYAKQIGMAFVESWVPGIDAEFAALDLTQEQVDALMRSHAWRIKHLFTPATYTLGQRFKLALHFLFG